MEIVANNYLPGDQRLVDKIVYELKAQGIFDQFRKECFADVDTKPAYQNLRQRVENNVTGFLKEQSWRPDMNKNQVREMLRKRITESGYLETGVERIVDQVVNPKINSVFLPKVEEVVYKYLGIEKPNRDNTGNDNKDNIDGSKNDEKSTVKTSDLLPQDLEAVSPESEFTTTEKKDDKNNNNNNTNSNDNTQDVDDSKMEEDESPPFEPLEEQSVYNPQEENSIDSHMSGFSGLISHESNFSSDNKPIAIDLNQQDSQMSRNSSESHLSIVTSDDNSKMDICDDSQSKSIKSTDSNSRIDEKKDDNKSKIDKSKQKIDRKDDRDRERERKSSTSSSSKDSKSRHSSSHHSRDRDRNREHRESKSSSKNDKDRSKDKDKDKKGGSSSFSGGSSSSKHSSSSKDREKNRKESSSKDRERDRNRSSNSSHHDKDTKKSSDTIKKSEKLKKDDKSSHSSDRSKKDKDKKKDTKPKDDHYSSRDKKNDRRSADRDSNGGNTGGNSSSSGNNNNNSNNDQSNKQSNDTNSSKSNNNSGDSNNSGNSEQKEEIVNNNNNNISSTIKLIKPKFASNIKEAMKLMKIRKQLAKLEKQNQLSLTSVDVNSKTLISSSICLEDIKPNGLIKKVDSTNINNNDNDIDIDDINKHTVVISQENWDRMEAKLNEEIQKDDNCRYFENDINYNKYLEDFNEFVNNEVEKFDEFKSKFKSRKRTFNRINHDNNHHLYHHRQDYCAKRPKLDKRNHNFSEIIQQTPESFPLPLSPAESDNSLIDKKEATPPLKPKRNKINKNNSQRYSSDDLYKPRPTFISSRRRGAKTMDN